MQKKDLYTMKLSRREAYMLFLAAGEMDLTVLPWPITDVEIEMFDLCKAQAANAKARAEQTEAVQEPGAEAIPAVKPATRKAKKVAGSSAKGE